MFVVQGSINISPLRGGRRLALRKPRAGKDARAPQPGMAALRVVRLSADDDGIRKTVVNRSFVRIDQGISHSQAKERERENKTDGPLD